MNKSKEYKESKESAYVQNMAKAQREIRREIKPASTIQCASTQESLDTTNEQYAEKVKLMFDKGSWKAPHPDEVARKITPEEFVIIKGLRQASKNTIGQSEKSSISEERKELGRQAFSHTPPTPLTDEQKEKLVKLDLIKQLDTMPKEEWKDLTPFQAFKHWITGNKIKKVDKND